MGCASSKDPYRITYLSPLLGRQGEYRVFVGIDKKTEKLYYCFVNSYAREDMKYPKVDYAYEVTYVDLTHTGEVIVWYRYDPWSVHSVHYSQGESGQIQTLSAYHQGAVPRDPRKFQKMDNHQYDRLEVLFTDSSTTQRV